MSNYFDRVELDSFCSTLCEHNQALVKSFLRNKQLDGSSVNTIMCEQRNLREFIRYVGDVPLDEITAEQIEDWYLWYVATPLKNTGKPPKQATVMSIVGALRQFMESMHGEEKMRKMFSRIRPKRSRNVTVREEELLTDDEIKRMISSCKNERDRAIIMTLYSTGCRVGELINLRIKDIEFEGVGASLHLDGKTGQRDIDIYIGVAELKTWLNVHPFSDDPDAPVFGCMRGSGWHPLVINAVEVMLNRRAKEAGIPEGKRYHPHAFRHRRATDLADQLTAAELNQVFGWTERSNTSSLYVHSSRDKIKRKLAGSAGIPIQDDTATSQLVRVCPVCHAVNTATARWCLQCHAVLDEELARTEKRVREFMLSHMDELFEKNEK